MGSNPSDDGKQKKTTPNGVVFFCLAEDEGFELRFSCVYGVFETFMFTKRRFYFSYPIIPNCSIQTNPLKGNLKGKNKGNYGDYKSVLRCGTSGDSGLK